MKGGICETENQDGSRWTVNRIGPFVTTGGYDWVQIGWENLWGLEEKLKAYPEGIYVTAQHSGPVDKDGVVLSHPPIHIHHIHIGPRPGVRQHQDVLKCLLNGWDNNRDCYDPTRVFEHHGDYQCIDEEGGLECLLETVPDGYGKLLTYPLGLEGDINDVRAPGSEPLEWYYQISIRWTPKESRLGRTIQPMHFHNFAGPGNFDRKNQNSYILTYQCPTDRDSLFWYSGRMPYSGEMLRNKFHAHNKIFKEALFFAASPEELGLTKKNGLKPDQPFKTVDLRDTRFSTLDDVKSFILGNLEKSASDFDKRNGVGGTGKIDYSTQFSRERPRTICQGVSTLEKINGYFYDRKEDTCCRPWHIEKGDIFTVVGFNKQLKYAPGPHAENYPPTFPGHIGWWLSVASEEPEPKSFFSIALYNQDPNSFPGKLGVDFMDRLTRLSILTNGGVMPGSVSFTNYPVAYFLLGIIDIFVRHAMWCAAIIIAIALRCVYSRHVTKSSSKSGKEYQYQPVKTTSVRESDDTCPAPGQVMDKLTQAVTIRSEMELREAMGKAL